MLYKILQEAFGDLPAARIFGLSIYSELSECKCQRDPTAILAMVQKYQGSHPFVNCALQTIHAIMMTESRPVANAIAAHPPSTDVLRSTMTTYRDDPTIMIFGAWILVSLAFQSSMIGRRPVTVVDLRVLPLLAGRRGFNLIGRALELNRNGGGEMVQHVANGWMHMLLLQMLFL